MGEVPASLVKQAIEDVAARTGATEAEIEIVGGVAVTWNDGSLGCPQRGVAYIQMIVDGYQIQLLYKQRVYDYHTNATTVFLCENALADQGETTSRVAPALRLVTLAMKDLSQRLNLPTNQIVPEPIITRVWPDTGLGCPEIGQVYAAVETQGYEIRLKVGEQVFTYHSDLEQVVYCPTP
jgi:hypothetical protein